LVFLQEKESINMTTNKGSESAMRFILFV